MSMLPTVITLDYACKNNFELTDSKYVFFRFKNRNTIYKALRLECVGQDRRVHYIYIYNYNSCVQSTMQEITEVQIAKK